MQGELFGGRFRVEASIGSGRLGSVYRAADLRLEAPATLKLLHPAIASEPRIRDAILARARAVAALDDPHLVPVLESGIERGQAWIASGWAEGGSLKDFLAKRKEGLFLENAAPLVVGILKGLQALHAKGIVHGAIHARNILLTRKMNPLLSDAGLAIGLDPASLAALGIEDLDPRTAAPEWIDPSRAVPGASADLYACGILFFRLLAGGYPFDAPDPQVVKRAQLEASLPPVVGLPPPVTAVLGKALAKVPGNRFRTPAEMIAALEALVRGEVPVQEKAVVKPPTSPGPPAKLPSEPARPAAPTVEEVRQAARPTDHAGTIERGLLFTMVAVLGVFAVLGLVATLLLRSEPEAPGPRPTPRPEMVQGPSGSGTGSSPVATDSGFEEVDVFQEMEEEIPVEELPGDEAFADLGGGQEEGDRDRLAGLAGLASNPPADLAARLEALRPVVARAPQEVRKGPLLALLAGAEKLLAGKRAAPARDLAVWCGRFEGDHRARAWELAARGRAAAGDPKGAAWALRRAVEVGRVVEATRPVQSLAAFRKQLSGIAGQDPQAKAALLDLTSAAAALEQGNLEAAKAHMGEAGRAYPASRPAMSRYFSRTAARQFRRGRGETVPVLVATALEFHEANAEAHAVAGLHALMQRGDAETASRHYRRALAIGGVVPGP